MTAEEICENSTKLITFMDLAGHRKYLRTTVQGLSGYSPHYVMLVVSGRAGVLGMTCEHLALAVALDVPLFVVVTKTDLGSPDETVLCLQSILKSVGCCRVSIIYLSIQKLGWELILCTLLLIILQQIKLHSVYQCVYSLVVYSKDNLPPSE